jgi:anti-sigma-K factor RskA
MSSETADDFDNIHAAEYVIGLLSANERTEAERRIRTDQGFARHVSQWEAHLSALNSEYSPVKPPARVKKKIDKRLFGSKNRGWLPWLFGLASTAAVLVAVWFGGLGGLGGLDGPQVTQRANLLADDAAYRFVVELGDTFTVAEVEGTLPQGRVYELWLLPEGAAPISLGTFDGVTTLPLPSLQAASTLAVSLEPLGGSPTGLPTGPVLAVGVLGDV